jgi:hypothetical protein
MLSLGIPPIIVAGILGHSLAILMTTYAHYIPGTQDEAARLMDDSDPNTHRASSFYHLIFI